MVKSPASLSSSHALKKRSSFSRAGFDGAMRLEQCSRYRAAADVRPGLSNRAERSGGASAMV